MRWLVQEQFSKSIAPFLDSISHVAIIGGSERDAEAVFLKQRNPNISFTVYGVEKDEETRNYHYLDLNENVNNVIDMKFDLILCSQVLEHVWNHQNFFRNLAQISSVNSLLWLGCPASNMVHGSPNYFSAGFTAEYLALNLEMNGFVCIDFGQIGSRRNYIGTHLGREWLSESEHRRPFRDYVWREGSFLGKINRYRKVIPGRIFLVFLNAKVRTDLEYATESWYLGTKKI